MFQCQWLIAKDNYSVDPLRATHVYSTLPVVAVDVVGFKPLDEGRKSGLESDRGEGVVFDDLFVGDSQKLTRDR